MKANSAQLRRNKYAGLIKLLFYCKKSCLKILPSLIFCAMLCLGVKVKGKSQCLRALVGGKQ